MRAKLQIAGLYSRVGDYFYSNTSEFKIGLCNRINPKPHQPSQYLMLFAMDGFTLPNGKLNEHLSGLYPKTGGCYKVEYNGTYYKVNITLFDAFIEVWNNSTSTSTQTPHFV